MSLSSYKHLIFDFDGTLADSLPLQIEIFNVLARKYQRPELLPDQIEEVRQLSARELIQKLGIPFYKLPALFDEGRSLYAERLEMIKLFPGMKQVLHSLHQTKDLAIISSSPIKVITSILEKEGCLDVFEQILTERHLFGKHRPIKKLLKERKWAQSDCVYIGDEVRDAEAAQQSGIDFVAVKWGFTSGKRLMQTSARSLCSTPQDFLK